MRDQVHTCGSCGYYLKNILKFLLSHIGLVSLVVGYTILGAFIFEKLEVGAEQAVKQKMIRRRTDITNRLWEISENLPYLEEEEWSKQAKKTLQSFETLLITAIKEEGWDGREDLEDVRWTFAGALFYSIILITTIGYGHISPKTEMGKVVTIFYAIPGVPLMMLCLANIGDGMAHSFRFLYWKVCCYACQKRPKKKRRPRSFRTPSRSRYPSMNNPNRTRPSSFRKSARGSQRSADSAMNDSYYQYPDPSFNYDHALEGGDERRPMPDRPHMTRGEDRKLKDDDPRGSKTPTTTLPRTRGSQNSNKSTGRLEVPVPEAVANANTDTNVFYNKYATENEDGSLVGPSTIRNPMKPSEPQDPRTAGQPRDSMEREMQDHGHSREPPSARTRSRTRERMREPEVDPKSMRPPPGVRGHPPEAPIDPAYRNDSGFYSRQIGPPDTRAHLASLEDDPRFYYDDDYDEDDDTDTEDHSEKPVPIWLGVMLVVLYIIAGAILFNRWEEWPFLDSVYFCFITLTTIGFGDFVPAQTTKKGKSAELSIALCSLYLLFGIALLAMSFNLVQEEVISSVRNVAKRLGVIKEDEEEE